MKEQDPHIHELFRKYLESNYTEEELQQLLAYFNIDKHDQQLKQLIYAKFENDVPDHISEADIDTINHAMDKYVMEHTGPRRSTKSRYLWWAAAASLIAVFFLISRYFGQSPDQPATIAQQQQLLPGSNKATLTLADGSTVVLDENKEGIIIGDELTYNDGTAILDGRTEGMNNRATLLTLSTPKGGQYQLVLPDGTKVFLNAESKLSYPSKFLDPFRKVELSGEAYFDVRHDARKPFIVSIAGQEVKVLGTAFNINAYPEENMLTTTLVQGSVQLTKDNAKAVTLKPGEQAVSTASAIRVSKVDPSEATAWKDGKFVFSDTDIHAVMRQIERWYDAEVVYTDNLSGDITFSGSISRYDDIRDVLRKIELTKKIKFEIEGRRISVSRK